MSNLKKIPLILLGAGGAFFGETFTIYFYNLHMKTTALIEPILLKHYDTMPRNRYL